MNILHLSNTPLSNAPANLALVQRGAGHDARVLLHRQSNTNKVFVGGDLWNTLSKEALEGIFNKAHVVHLHNFAWEQEIFRHHPQLAEICRKKKCLIQYHSPRFSTENFDTTIKDPFFNGRKAVIAQYHVRQYPEAEFVVPNVLPIYDPRYMPLKNKPNMLPLVSYAPSNTNLKGWDDKGYALTIGILRQAESTQRLRAEVITNTPYEETLLKKKWADIGIDEIVTGSYHLSFLEYMSMGVVGITNMDDATAAAMAMVVGWEAMQEIPSVKADKWTLEKRLIGMTHSREELRHRGALCRNWMEKYWSPLNFVKYYGEIYAKL